MKTHPSVFKKIQNIYILIFLLSGVHFSFSDVTDDLQRAIRRKPISEAERVAYMAELQDLIDKGADLNRTSGAVKNPLIFSAANPIAVQVLVEADDKLINATDLFDRTALFFANNPETAQAFIDAGLDPKAIGRYQDTALHHIQSPAIAKVLLDAGAKPNAKDRSGETPMHSADNKAFAGVLVEAGGNPYAKDAHGRIPRIALRSAQIAEAAQADGVDLTKVTDGKGDSLLQLAKTEELTQFLLNNGLVPNQSNNEGHTLADTTQSDEIQTVVENFSKQHSACSYADGSSQVKVTPSQCGNQSLCFSKIHCAFNIDEVRFVQDFNAVCRSEGEGCPSAHACAIDSSVADTSLSLPPKPEPEKRGWRRLFRRNRSQERGGAT